MNDVEQLLLAAATLALGVNAYQLANLARQQRRFVNAFITFVQLLERTRK